MQNRTSFFDQLNNIGFGLYLAVTGAVSYLTIKTVKKLLDMLCDAIMQKYTKSVEDKAEIVVDRGIKKVEESFDRKFSGIKADIRDIKDNMKTDKERSHDSIAKNEGVLNEAMDTLKKYKDELRNEKTIINIPANKHKS